jgi:diguanylate cyclase (GGDEF)-like protein
MLLQFLRRPHYHRTMPSAKRHAPTSRPDDAVTVEEDKLSGVLSEFARTMVTDFPIQAILDHLVERIVEVLPISAAGVTLISAGRAPRYVAASDEAAMRWEQLQTEVGQGPCLSAYESAEAVAVPDLAGDGRFPLFAAAAVAAGLGAVFTFPLHAGEGGLGALDLYRDTPGELGAHAMAAAQILADVAAAYLLNAQAREDARVSSDRFHHESLHDSLTGLPNRALLEERIQHAAHRARRSNTNAAILFADLDRFKQINDTHGHHAGDKLLLDVAGRLAGLVRPGDTLARVSGDEFVFLCEDLRSQADVEILATRIDRSFRTPFVLAGAQVPVTASVGIAFAGPGENISDKLVVTADAAMYQAKRKGGARHQIIDLREDLQTQDRTSLERDLRRAFAREELTVAYQPIVRTADGRVTGVEALVRWMHPERGPIPAISIVDIAEQSGLISEIGAWVLERACRDRGRWLARHPRTPLDLAVNVSARQLLNPNFCTVVAGVLAATPMDPAALVLEVTETIIVDESDRAIGVLNDLKELGVRLAMDDFGTGYSSLSYLRRLPIEIVKIDQSFIAAMGNGPTSGAITAAVTNLAHVLGLTVSAEGVETRSQRDEIAAIGCDAAQGFFYAKPMAADAIAVMLGAAPTHAPKLPAAPRRRAVASR